MTIYHKHHIIPKHMGGTNDPSNLVEVTIEKHAALHKQLWEDLGHWQDKLAWLSLSKQISHNDIRILKTKLYQDDLIEKGDHKYLSSEYQSRLGKISQEKRKENKTFVYDYEWQKENSKFFDKNWQYENGFRWSVGDKQNPLCRQNQTQLLCVKCGKTMSKGNYIRWKHGDDCGQK